MLHPDADDLPAGSRPVGGGSTSEQDKRDERGEKSLLLLKSSCLGAATTSYLAGSSEQDKRDESGDKTALGRRNLPLPLFFFSPGQEN